MANNTFVNPYTFIGLGDRVSKAKSEDDDRHTGVLSCTLKTLTPMAIPNAANEDTFIKIADNLVTKWNSDFPDKKVDRKNVRSYDFYSYENPEGDMGKVEKNQLPSPVIPGSSIRGMIRSAYEALTDSCLSAIDEEMILNKRSIIPYDRDHNSENMGVGILENVNGKWILKKGEKALLPIKGVKGFSGKTNNETGREFFRFYRDKLLSWGNEIFISFKGTSRGYKVVSSFSKSQKGEDKIPAYHLPGVQFGDRWNKHFDTIVYNYKNSESYDLSEDDISRIKLISSLYKENAKGESENTKKPVPYDGWANFDLGKPFPVYYETVKGDKVQHGNKLKDIYYISPACISQEIFARKVSDMIGDFDPCKDNRQLCDACYLFGMVGKEEGRKANTDKKTVNAVASRISFRDAVSLDKEDWYDEPKRLAILGQPRPSATEFYMTPLEDGDYWNYDYKVTHGKRREDKNKKTALETASIRGRKFYWHSDDDKTRYAKDADRPDLTIIARPVKKECSFKFEVAFENISRQELAKLIYVLTIGGKASGDNPTHGHKLGHGKPIGFGSVGISINEAKSSVFEMDGDFNIRHTPLPKLPDIFETLSHTTEFLRVTDWEKKHDNVMYPQNGPEGDVFAWFQANRKGCLTDRGIPDSFNLRFIKTLPDLSDKENDQNLPLEPSPESNNQRTNTNPPRHASHQTNNRNRNQTRNPVPRTQLTEVDKHRPSHGGSTKMPFAAEMLRELNMSIDEDA